jgi:hypothetical protein
MIKNIINFFKALFRGRKYKVSIKTYTKGRDKKNITSIRTFRGYGLKRMGKINGKWIDSPIKRDYKKIKKDKTF